MAESPSLHASSLPQNHGEYLLSYRKEMDTATSQGHDKGSDKRECPFRHILKSQNDKGEA